MTRYEFYDYEKVNAQIKKVQKFVLSETNVNVKIAFLRSTLLTQQNAMDLRYEALDQLTKLGKKWSKLVVPVLIEFLETDESRYDDPNYIRAEEREIFDSYYYQYDDYDEHWFTDLKEAAIDALDPDLVETKEAFSVLLSIVKNEFYEDYIIEVPTILQRLGELYQDIRYLLYVHLHEVCEYNDSAKQILEYLDAFYNQIDFLGECFSLQYFSEKYPDEN